MAEDEFFAPGDRVAVRTGQLDGALDYRAPPAGCTTGSLVEVPLGPRLVTGVIWGPGAGGFDPAKLRAVARVLDVPPLSAELRGFLDRAGAYTLTAPHVMLRLALRAPGLAQRPADRKILRPGGPPPARMTEARLRVLDALAARPEGLAPGELAAEAGVGSAVIRGLVQAGSVIEVRAPRDAPFPPLDLGRPGLKLNAGQRQAAQALCAAVAAAAYSTTLLKGVTGSGKTEVYLEAVAECVRHGRQALVLLPEIALTAGFMARVEARFGARPAEWHSGMTQAERRRVWLMAAGGDAPLVVGARSALFLPFRDLGLVVVDEEHDTSYKQEDGVQYHARDMAVLRGAEAGAAVILASATPALESWANARAGKYQRCDLPERAGAATLPDLAAIDMREQGLPTGRWVSPALAAAVRAALDRGDQALLFLNRRGYAPVTLCRACGAQIGCPDCDARMVEHRFLRQLMCHQCGRVMDIPDACPECGAADRLAALGPGVERLQEEAAALFPEARIAVLSSDLFGSARALKARLAEIAEGGADIVIGTQLVAKGHNFPLLTLVGVIDADLALGGADLRAAERTFQLMRQVAGRAGRADRPGRALLQTYQPDHPVIRAILGGDDEAFWAAEAAERQASGMPPFGRLAGVILSGTDLKAVSALGAALARETAPLAAIGAEVWGPAPAPIARIRGRHRMRLLIRADKGAALQEAVAAWLAPIRLKGDLRLSVDIDPQSFL
ncbi:MAG: primosomal protein N' [Rhodobacteraceae bacterium]|nr:primosomal protein N' [Paracoccaceae bacterium]